MKVLALVLLLAGCASSGPEQNVWHARVDIHGTMRAVMMEGRTQGRVELSSLQGDPELVGIGALEGLEGEVVLLDGVAWCTRAEKLGALATQAGPAKGTQATLLAVTSVPRWLKLPVPTGMRLSALEAFVARAARDHGLARTETFPFVVEGAFSDVRAHVLHGRCPYLGAGPPETEPVRRSLPLAHGRLVGFYTELPSGTLTHAGEKTHVHLLIKEGEALVAHVDDLRINAGAYLKLPLPK